MYYAVRERKGFVVITGEIGAGKTTITRTLLGKFGMNTKIALITNTHLTARELIEEILDELEVDYKPGTKRKLLAQLNAYLIQQLADDINVVLIIDEAQNLTPKVLEEVRMLSNLETETEKLIQIILLGQPQLKRKLERGDLEQFKQRIAVYYHLPSLTREETGAYIRHRIKVVTPEGGSADVFTSRAIDAVHEHARGIPRVINLLCDSALLTGYVDETKVITDAVIEDVVHERDFEGKKEMEFSIESQVSGRIGGFAETQGVVRERVTHCCPGCDRYMTCLTKWERGTRGEEQVCCPECSGYKRCSENARAREV